MKIYNDLVDLFPDYDHTPKAVIAAVCWSIAERLSAFDDSDDAADLIRKEWAALHANGIVPQKPVARVEGDAEQR